MEVFAGFTKKGSAVISPDNGRVEYLFGFIINITDRKRAEEALKKSEEKYRFLVEMMTQGLLVQDENGFIIYANDSCCKMLRYQQDELIGKPIIDLLDERNQQIVKGEIARRRNGAPVQSCEVEITIKDGGRLPVLLSPRDILDSDGQF